MLSVLQKGTKSAGILQNRSGETGNEDRDLQFTSRDFDWLRSTANAYSGIVLSEAKRNMVYSRLAKRLRTLGFKTFSQYRKLLESGNEREFSEFINALTTNLTYFFREPHHFEHLKTVAIPERLAEARTSEPVQIWSAGCSTGEEPYSICHTAGDAIDGLDRRFTYSVFASDLDTRVLQQAASGVYDLEKLEKLDRTTVRRMFLKGTGSHSGKVRVKKPLRDRVSFRQINLTKHLPIDAKFDVIFCRNVVIYFDRPTQHELFERFADRLRTGGYLYLGHSESMFQTMTRFALVGKTTYQKVR